MKKWLILVFLVVFSGCSSSNMQTSVDNNDEKQEVITKGIDTVDESSYKIIQKSSIPVDQAEYMDGQEMMKSYHSDSKKELEEFANEYQLLTSKAVPTFDGTMVIAKMGTKSSGGYSIDLVDVKEAGRYTEVTLSFNSPAKGSLVTASLTNPYIIIFLPENHKEIKIIKK